MRSASLCAIMQCNFPYTATHSHFSWLHPQASPLQNPNCRSLQHAQQLISNYLREWQVAPGHTTSQRPKSQLVTSEKDDNDDDKKIVCGERFQESNMSFDVYFQGLKERVLSSVRTYIYIHACLLSRKQLSSFFFRMTPILS